MPRGAFGVTTMPIQSLELLGELLAVAEAIGLVDGDTTFEAFEAALARGEDEVAELSALTRTP